MKKVLVINGHPDKESFCFALAAAAHMKPWIVDIKQHNTAPGGRRHHMFNKSM
jgi:putative NADPH-quinone reductase